MQNAKFKEIAIIGVGLIGGSIGLAVKKRKLADKLIGIGRNEISLSKALKRNAVDEVTIDKSKVRDSDLVILAVPVGKIVSLVKELIPHLKEETIITDVGSTKRGIMQEVEKFLSPSVNFVGGHPLAGSEKSGVEYADADLFEDSVCFLVPRKNTHIKKSIGDLKSFWRALGANPVVTSAEEHDFLMAGISHLPHVVAVTLVNSVSGVGWKGKKLAEFAGQGWKDTTRISQGSPEVWTDIIFSNREKLLLFVEKFNKEWNRIRRALEEEDFKELNEALRQATENFP